MQTTLNFKKRPLADISSPEHSSLVTPPPSKKLKLVNDDEGKVERRGLDALLREFVEKPEDRDFEAYFYHIADTLMNDYELAVQNSPSTFRICEVEFYLNDLKAKGHHPDTFTHGDPI